MCEYDYIFNRKINQPDLLRIINKTYREFFCVILIYIFKIIISFV